MQEKHQTSIPAKVLTEVQAKINQANELLAPYVLALTASERQTLPKMGNKTLSFVEKALAFAEQYPEICPSYLNLSDFEIDLTDATGLRKVLVTSQQLTDNLDDTAMVAGSEAYQAALIFYQATKAAAAQNIPGAKEAYAELKERFPKTKVR